MPPLVTPMYTQTLLTLSVGASAPFSSLAPFFWVVEISPPPQEMVEVSPPPPGDEQIMITSSSLQQETKMWHNYFPLYLLPW